MYYCWLTALKASAHTLILGFAKHFHLLIYLGAQGAQGPPGADGACDCSEAELGSLKS